MLRLKSGFLTVLILVVVCFVAMNSGPARASNYSCPLWSHCYSLAKWYGNSYGLQSHFKVNVITRPVDGAMSEEAWLIDNNTSQFTEGGYNVGYYGAAEQYFWGGTLPDGSVQDYGLGYTNGVNNFDMWFTMRYIQGSPNFVTYT